MRILLALSAVLTPALAFAGHGGHACPMHPGCGGGGGLLGAALMAGAAALGWWVARQAGKDSGKTRVAGLILGWTLAVFGLAGFLCGSISHMAKKMCPKSGASCPLKGMSSGAGLPEGHPPVR